MDGSATRRKRSRIGCTSTGFSVEKRDQHFLCHAVGHGEWHESVTGLRSFTAWASTGRAVAYRLPSCLHTEQHTPSAQTLISVVRAPVSREGVSAP